MCLDWKKICFCWLLNLQDSKAKASIPNVYNVGRKKLTKLFHYFLHIKFSLPPTLLRSTERQRADVGETALPDAQAELHERAGQEAAGLTLVAKNISNVRFQRFDAERQVWRGKIVEIAMPRWRANDICAESDRRRNVRAGARARSTVGGTRMSRREEGNACFLQLGESTCIRF